MKLPDDPGLVSGAGFFASVLDWARKVTRNFNPLHDDVATLKAQLAQALLDLKGPAFSAYSSIVQGWPPGAPPGGLIKIQCNVEEFDTNNCYDNVTNFRFQPNVAGYYQLNAQWLSNFSTNVVGAYIMKNGAAFKRGSWPVADPLVGNLGSNVSALVFLNGSTDYAEFYAYSGTDSLTYNTEPPIDCYFQGFLARRPN